LTTTALLYSVSMHTKELIQEWSEWSVVSDILLQNQTPDNLFAEVNSTPNAQDRQRQLTHPVQARKG
jgi:hypothetical protein